MQNASRIRLPPSTACPRQAYTGGIPNHSAWYLTKRVIRHTFFVKMFLLRLIGIFQGQPASLSVLGHGCATLSTSIHLFPSCDFST